MGIKEPQPTKWIKDPSAWRKNTPNRFVYDVTSEPLWDGSGSISYTTTGQFAIGEIDKVNIINLGLNYKKVPSNILCDKYHILI